MNKIIHELKQLKPSFAEKYKVSTIDLFGSAVRNDFTAPVDIDMMVGFNNPVGIVLIEFADLIESQLKTLTDLVCQKAIKQK